MRKKLTALVIIPVVLATLPSLSSARADIGKWL
jgi:hypothetical protein